MIDPQFRSIEHGTRMLVDALDGLPQGMTHFAVDQFTHEPRYVAPGVTGGTLTIEYRLDTAPVAGPMGPMGHTGPMGMAGEPGPDCGKLHCDDWRCQ